MIIDKFNIHYFLSVKHITPILSTILVVITSFQPGTGIQAQDAVISSFRFDVNGSLRADIPKYDRNGTAQGKFVNGQWQAETSKEIMRSTLVHQICETLQAAVTEVYSYESVEIAYPGALAVTVHPSRMNGFPGFSLKKAKKKNPANNYIECEFKINGRSSGSLVVMGKQREPSVKISAEISLSIFDKNGIILDAKNLVIQDFTDEFDGNFVASIEKEFTRIQGVSHLSPSQMEQIFLGSLQRLLR